ncbi:hypothetical protein D3C71_1840800 [compost metagenome]
MCEKLTIRTGECMIIVGYIQQCIAVFHILKGNACMASVNRVCTRSINNDDTLLGKRTGIIQINTINKASNALFRYVRCKVVQLNHFLLA